MSQGMPTRRSRDVDPSFAVDPPFGVEACVDESLHVVKLSGELDLTSCAAALAECTAADEVDVVVDLSDVVFMDCAGYRALVAAHAVLEQRGGSLVVTGATGEPLRLLSIIEQGSQPLGAERRHSSTSTVLR